MTTHWKEPFDSRQLASQSEVKKGTKVLAEIPLATQYWSPCLFHTPKWHHCSWQPWHTKPSVITSVLASFAPHCHWVTNPKDGWVSSLGYGLRFRHLERFCPPSLAKVPRQLATARNLHKHLSRRCNLRRVALRRYDEYNQCSLCRWHVRNAFTQKWKSDGRIQSSSLWGQHAHFLKQHQKMLRQTLHHALRRRHWHRQQSVVFSGSCSSKIKAFCHCFAFSQALNAAFCATRFGFIDASSLQTAHRDMRYAYIIITLQVTLSSTIYKCWYAIEKTPVLSSNGPGSNDWCMVGGKNPQPVLHGLQQVKGS